MDTGQYLQQIAAQVGEIHTIVNAMQTDMAISKVEQGQMKGSIEKLSQKVTTQNGRVTKLERAGLMIATAIGILLLLYAPEAVSLLKALL